MIPKIIVPVEVEPITIEEARQHLEAQSYGDSDVDPADDAMIEAMIGAAREHCENFLGLSLATKTLEIALDQFPRVHKRYPWLYAQHRSHHREDYAIELPMGPVREIVSIFVPAQAEFTSDDVDSDATADAPVWADGEVNPDNYALDNYSLPGKVTPVSSWPTIATATNAVKIRYLAGYGVDSDGGEPLPKAIRSAILLVLGDLMKNRENDVAGSTSPGTTTAEALMRPLRVRLGMA